MSTSTTSWKGLARRVASTRAGAPVGRYLERAGAVQLGRRLTSLSAGAPGLVTVPLPPRLFAQRSLRLDTADGRDGVAVAAWRRGWDAYEAPLPAFYAASVRDGDTVLDVGANTGFYALLATCVGAGVRVHAVEPYPPVLDRLERNLALNEGGARVTVHRVAVDDRTGEAELHVPLDRHGLVETSASIEPSFRSVWGGSVTVPRTTLDLLAADLDRVDVMKVDVECLEDRVLEGARGLLARHRPVVFFEVLDCEDWHADCPRLDAVRQEADYVSVRLHPREALLAAQVGYDEPWRNQALWPAEKVPELEAVCARLGLPLGRAAG